MVNASLKKCVQHLLLALVALFLMLPVSARAAGNYTPSELDTLVSNIALYPDPLLTHVLTASMYGDQIPAANLWAQSHSGLKGQALSAELERSNLDYDPSVQALLPFPTVLAMMDKYASWCNQLGDAVANQESDVLEAVQRMRQSAVDHGHLKSNEQVIVKEEKNVIVISPVRTEYVYVPVYNPRVVYYVYADGYTRISYGYGVWMGTWYTDWGWYRPAPRRPRYHHHNPPPPHHGPHARPVVAPKPAARPAPAPRTAAAPVSRATAAPAPTKQTVVRPDTRAAAAQAKPTNRMSVAPAPTSKTAPAPAPRATPAPKAAPAPAPSYNAVPARKSSSDEYYEDRRYDSRNDSRSGSRSDNRSGFGNATRSTSTTSNSGRSQRDDQRSGNGGGSHRSSGGFGKAVRR